MRRSCYGITSRQCLVALNIVFGVCAIVALTIGIFLVIHEQAKEDERQSPKTDNSKGGQ